MASWESELWLCLPWIILESVGMALTVSPKKFICMDVFEFMYVYMCVQVASRDQKRASDLLLELELQLLTTL